MVNVDVGRCNSDDESSCLEESLGKINTKDVRMVRSSIEK